MCRHENQLACSVQINSARTALDRGVRAARSGAMAVERVHAPLCVVAEEGQMRLFMRFLTQPHPQN